MKGDELMTAKTTMLPFFRQEDDGSETCFYVEYRGPLNEDQRAKLNASLSPFFKYLPTHNVTTTSQLVGELIGEVGPRLSRETPESSSTVGIFQDTGHPEIARVEKFRRHVLPIGVDDPNLLLDGLYDPITEAIYPQPPKSFYVEVDIAPVEVIPLLTEGIEAVRRFCEDQSLNFNKKQIKRIVKIFTDINKNPTDVALFQLAQMWSDHARHLIFNAILHIDGERLPHTLFDLVKAPYNKIKDDPNNNIHIAFFDNASATEGYTVPILVPSEPGSACPYIMQRVTLHHILSGETHCYPGHVYPYAGAATEIGGEIRDQLACGKASDILYAGCGRVVGSLFFPNGYRIPGEVLKGRWYEYPTDKATPIEIVINGLRGWHDYANCFGKPTTFGFFYSGAIWQPRYNGDNLWFERYESLKPLCFGVSGGTIRQEHLKKAKLLKGHKILVIGGPAYDVGWMGAVGSSSGSGKNVAKFDESAVQRGNAEMQRRFYQVVLAAIAMGVKIVFQSSHDQGGGGIANMLTELMEMYGGELYIGSVRRGDPTMPDVKVYICEYQERQGVVVAPEDVPKLLEICERENCPMEILGEITGDGKLVVYSEKDAEEVRAKNAEPIIEMSLADVMEDLPPMEIHDFTPDDVRLPLEIPPDLTIEQAAKWVAQRSENCKKTGIIETVDGSIGGQVILNQYCGPFGTPVVDCSLVSMTNDSREGQAASIGTTPYMMVLDPEAAARMAIGEMFTNLMGVCIEGIKKISCICNSMMPLSLSPPDGEIVRAVKAYNAGRITLEELIIAVIGGKDSSSLYTKVMGKIVKSIPTIVYSSVVGVPDVSKFITPWLRQPGQSVLILADIADGQRRLGASSFSLALGQLGEVCPDLDDTGRLSRAFTAVQKLIHERLITAGHDVSSGGALQAVEEMCFATGCGSQLELHGTTSPFHEYFAEELGYVVEASKQDASEVCDFFEANDVPFRILGQTTTEPIIRAAYNEKEVLNSPTQILRRWWERTGHEISKLKINPDVARRVWRNTATQRKAVHRLTFTPRVIAPAIVESTKQHALFVLRDKGTTCTPEMVAAWKRVGFRVDDIHITDLESGKVKSLDRYRGWVNPGGFSNMDALGAAVGMAKKIMLNPNIRNLTDLFRARSDTFIFGTCNGAQLGLRCGWAPWPGLPEEKQPYFTLNEARAFLHRWVMVKILESKSIFFKDMAGSILGVYVANAEGYFNCDHAPELLDRALEEKLVPMVYVDPLGRHTTAPPYSPSGSIVASVCDTEGTTTLTMPHALDRGDLARLWQFFPPEWEEMMPELENGLKIAPFHHIAVNAWEWCEDTK